MGPGRHYFAAVDGLQQQKAHGRANAQRCGGGETGIEDDTNDTQWSLSAVLQRTSAHVGPRLGKSLVVGGSWVLVGRKGGEGAGLERLSFLEDVGQSVGTDLFASAFASPKWTLDDDLSSGTSIGARYVALPAPGAGL